MTAASGRNTGAAGAAGGDDEDGDEDDVVDPFSELMGSTAGRKNNKRPKPEAANALQQAAHTSFAQYHAGLGPEKAIGSAEKKARRGGGGGAAHANAGGMTGADAAAAIAAAESSGATFAALQQAQLAELLAQQLVQQRSMPPPVPFGQGQEGMLRLAASGARVVAHPDDVGRLCQLLKDHGVFGFSLEFANRVAAAASAGSALALPNLLHPGSRPVPMASDAPCEASGLDGIAFSAADGAAFYVPLCVPDTPWGCAVWRHIVGLLLSSSCTKVRHAFGNVYVMQYYGTIDDQQEEHLHAAVRIL